MISLNDYLKSNSIPINILEEYDLLDQIQELWNQINQDKASNFEDISYQIQNLIFGKLANLDPFIEYKSQQFESQEEIESDEEDTVAKVDNKKLILKPILIQGQKLPETIESIEQVTDLTNQIRQDTNFKVLGIKSKQIKIKPKAPFTTSTLQQASSSFLGLSPKTTMQLAQRLYEGVEIDRESVALITYMRTDSLNLSEEFIDKARSYIQKNYSQYLPTQKRTYLGKSKNAQEAHEAIRPTNPLITPNSIRGKIDPKQHRLYELIWRQTVACQMSDEIREVTTFELENQLATKFSGSHTKTIFEGWSVLFKDRRKSNKLDLESKKEILKQKWIEQIGSF